MEHTKSYEYIPTLDGWRAIAIIGVLICHSSTVQNPKLHALFSLGAFGVHIFFAISGFLITSKLIDELKKDGRISLVHFYTRRAFRILPPALAYMAFIALLQGMGIVKIEPISWFGSLFFFKNFFFKDNSYYLTHFWSLSVEEQFYLVWPFILVAFTFRKTILFGFVVVFLTQIFSKSDSHLLYDFIVAGCLLAFLVKNKSYSNLLSKFSNPAVWVVFAFLLLAGITNKLPFSRYWLCWIFAMNVVWTVINPKSFISKILEFSLLKKIGKYSYSIYLWQELFCVMGDQNKVFPLIQNLPWNIPLTFICAYLSYKFIETPFIRMGRHLTSKEKQLQHTFT